MNLTRWRTLALWLIAALVTVASLAAFAQSYRGLYDWSRQHGLSGFWAAAWPIQLDAFIAVGELTLFVGLVDNWPRRGRVTAWTVTLVGAAVSVAGNVGHVAGSDMASRLTAAVPPIAAASMLFVALAILKRVTQTPRAAAPVWQELPATSGEAAGQATITVDNPDGRFSPSKAATLTVKQQAKRAGVSERTMYRRLAKADMVTAGSNGHSSA